MPTIITAPEPETGRSGHGIRTPVVGRIEFSDVTFSYPGAVSPALNRVSFTVPKAAYSGSSAAAVRARTRSHRPAAHALHADYNGLIKIDGSDLREYDVDHLRASLGVVLQENFLFRGTIRETIAAAKPHASFEEIVRAARLAGAEEFIERLPPGTKPLFRKARPTCRAGSANAWRSPAP